MRPIKREELEQRWRQALEQVEGILGRSYSPYSGLCVGAGLVLADGSVITGLNYESASYGLTLCAERTALAAAQTAGRISEVEALVLVTMRRDATAEEPPLTPCGACRQWLSELSGRLGRDIPVATFWRGGASGLLAGARELLPEAFS